ncbi:hypothetical protein ACQY0O_005689 [Thecaphora frezii]
MEIAEDLPTGFPSEIDYEMRIPGPSHLPPQHACHQPPLQPPLDDLMAYESFQQEDVPDGMMAEEYELQQGQSAAPTVDADVEFDEEAAVAAAGLAEAGASGETMSLETHADGAHGFPSADDRDAPRSGPLRVESAGAVPAPAVAPDVESRHGGLPRSTDDSPEGRVAGEPAAASVEAAGNHTTAASGGADPSDNVGRGPGSPDATHVEREEAQHNQAQPNRANEVDESADHDATEEDQLDHSLVSEDGTAPPTVRVSFNGQDFVLFSHDEPTSYLGASQADAFADHEAAAPVTVHIPAPKLKVADDIFWQPLENLFASLRVKDCLGEFLEESTELVLHMPDLDLTVPEDNVYCRDITLDDLFQLHQGLGYDTSLHLLVTEAQRFISRYNALAQHVANMIEQAQGEHVDLEHEGEAAEAQDADAAPYHAQHQADVTEADLNDEDDELETGEANPQAAAQALEDIVSAENAQIEDHSHEAYEDAVAQSIEHGGDDAAEVTADKGKGPVREPLVDELHGMTASEATGEDARAVEEPIAIAANEAGIHGDVVDGAEERPHEAEEVQAEGEQAEADQTYVTVDEDGEEEEVDEIEDGEEGEVEGEGGAYDGEGEAEEAWEEEQDYAEEEQWHEDGVEEELEEDGAEEEQEEEEKEDDDDDEEEEEEGGRGKNVEYEDAGPDGAWDGTYKEEDAEGSVTIEGSEESAGVTHIDAGGEGHRHSGDDEIVEYEDDEEGGVIEASAAASSKTDESIYGNGQDDAHVEPASGKRSLDDGAEVDELANNDLKRARVDQQA